MALNLIVKPKADNTAYLVEWQGSINGQRQAIAVVTGHGSEIPQLYDMLDDIGDVSKVKFQKIKSDTYVEIADEAYTKLLNPENNWKRFKGWDKQCPAL